VRVRSIVACGGVASVLQQHQRLEIPEGFAFLVERFLSFWSVIIMGVECSGFINGTLIALPRR
jgi:hypothetical protein